jgi:hypothetical protein
MAFINQMVAPDIVNGVSSFRVSFIEFFLQQVTFQVIDDIRLVSDVTAILQIVFNLMLRDFLIDISVLLMINKLPFVGTCIVDLMIGI